MTARQNQLQEERRIERSCQHLATRRDTSGLPPSVRRRLNTLRNPLLVDDVVAQIRADARDVAKARGGVVRGDGIVQGDFVPEAVLRRTMRDRATDASYRFWAKNLVEEAKRAQHLERLRSAGAVRPRFPSMTARRWEAVSDLGLGTATFLDAMPDQVAFAIAGLVSRARTEDDDENADDVTVDLEPVRALVLGAGPSTLCLALDSTERRNVSVVEVDAFESAVDPLCQEGRLCWTTDFEQQGPFDAIVLHPPAPALGAAAQYRNIYIEELSLDAEPRSGRLKDPGRLGPKKWCIFMEWVLASAMGGLADDGLLVLYIPLGVRMSWEHATGSRKPGSTYREEPLIGWLEPTLREAGIRVVRDVEVVEANPVAQPFVGLERCPHRLVVARKGAK